MLIDYDGVVVQVPSAKMYAEPTQYHISERSIASSAIYVQKDMKDDDEMRTREKRAKEAMKQIIETEVTKEQIRYK